MSDPNPVAASDLSAVMARLQRFVNDAHLEDLHRETGEEQYEPLAEFPTKDVIALLASHRSLTEGLERVAGRSDESARWSRECIAELDAWEDKWDVSACSSAFAERNWRERERYRQEAERLTAELAEARRALEPFATFATGSDGVPGAINDHGWAWPPGRLVDWFGPTDFRRAARALTPATIPEEEAQR